MAASRTASTKAEMMSDDSEFSLALLLIETVTTWPSAAAIDPNDH
jgi:hypothetical protein